MCFGHNLTSMDKDGEEIPLDTKGWSIRIELPLNKTLTPIHPTSYFPNEAKNIHTSKINSGPMCMGGRHVHPACSNLVSYVAGMWDQHEPWPTPSATTHLVCASHGWHHLVHAYCQHYSKFVKWNHEVEWIKEFKAT